jgi:thymidylate kinase
VSTKGHPDAPPGLARGIELLDESGLSWRQLSGGPDGPVLLVAAEDRRRAAALLAGESLPLRGETGAPPEAFLFYERDSDRWLILRTVTDPGGSRASPRGAVNLARRGVSVALLAPDGAGKSTLARALAAYPPLPVWTAYLGLYPRSGRRFAVPGVGFCVRVVRQWTHYLLARWHQARGMIVVFDRYPYDARLGPRRSGGRHDRLRRWLLGHVLPPPDLAIVLDAPAEVLRGRKDEQDIEELRRQRHEYLSLAGRLPCRTIVVDAGRSESDVRREVTDLIWQECVARSGRPAVRRARGG